MKIYINKLPKNCLNCPCHSRDFEEGDRCNLGAFNYNTCNYDKIDEDNYKHKDCPLIDIKTHDRELVKEVCEKIREYLRTQVIYCGGRATELDIMIASAGNQVLEDVKQFLDQIQKEIENGNIDK